MFIALVPGNKVSLQKIKIGRFKKWTLRGCLQKTNSMAAVATHRSGTCLMIVMSKVCIPPSNGLFQFIFHHNRVSPNSFLRVDLIWKKTRIGSFPV